MIISINHELPDLNSEISAAKRHWSIYAKHKKEATQLVAWHFKGKKPPTTEPLNIHFHWRCKNKRKDKDNIRFAVKYILDGMVEAGFIPNDNWQNIGSFGGDTFEVNKNNPGVDITIR